MAVRNTFAMKRIFVFVLCAICISTQAQFQLQGFNLGETTTNMRAIHIGNVAADAQIAARLHVNNFACSLPAGALNGFLFRTDGDRTVENRWQLFTGSSATTQFERFRVRTLAGGFDTYLERTQPGSEADIRLLTAQVEVRARNKRFFDEMLKC